ncbi:hypothetical protein [Sphingobacterium sp. LRF_L2]|uniref:hypothetical protein n=1 Tax=Sphingobacterium sp. LRF_L2 TaxID=3369421 RepID=UPI003F62D9D9
MESILKEIQNASPYLWDYYHGIEDNDPLPIPFTETNAHSHFIYRYFKRAGKVDVFNTSGIDSDTLHRPDHINSVFFLGILLYYKTGLHRRYKMNTNAPGYKSFPFIWFLIALFHDNAYAYERDENEKKKLDSIKTIDDLKAHFGIQHFLFDTRFRSNTQRLLNARNSYFYYRRNCGYKVIDHGLLGGILLYDRLYKIRKKKKREQEETLFWGPSLIYQYKMAANAISLHNIWLPEKEDEPLYHKYGLQNLIGLRKLKFKDFPLFYLLGIVDTIEPVKAFEGSGFDSAYILGNLDISFSQRSVTISNKPGSELVFSKLTDKLRFFDNWLDLKYTISETSFTINFR